MDIHNTTIVVTGGGSGIGEGLCRRFKQEGAKNIIVADIVESDAQRVASEIGGIPRTIDVTDESQIQALIQKIETDIAPIDIFCSNAGILCTDPDHAASSPNEDWDRLWKVNVLAHVFAARHMLPHMLKRGNGYLLNTASAAGLLSQLGSAPYSVTKHASIGFAESLAIAHGDQGIKVSIICPQAVRSKMTLDIDTGLAKSAAGDGVLEPEQLAETVMQGIKEEQFLILPHLIVETYMKRKTDDYDRWLSGMRRFKNMLESQ